MRKILLLTAFAGMMMMTNAQNYTQDLFSLNEDIGSCGIPGSMTYDPVTGSYTITGSGDNIWSGHDQFHFAWKKLNGDFILQANIRFVGAGSHAHRKIGWMLRKSLDTTSPLIAATVHGDGLTSLQYRLNVGENLAEIKSGVTSPGIIQLERKNGKIYFSVAVPGEPFSTVGLPEDAKFDDNVYAGIFICSHDNKVLEKAVFYNVRIIKPAPDNFIPYRDYIGSNLEILDLETGNRRMVMQSPVSIQAPNWTPDCKYLIYNSEGSLYRFDIEHQKAEKIYTGYATNNNNDHVLSFDGKSIGISHHVESESNNSIVFTVPLKGGNPKRVTPLGPSYLHGWSPDGNDLVYTGSRKGEFDIYKMSLKTKKEMRLTDAKGLDDGPEYSPDGKYIYFNSVRSGKMKLWRMYPDGSKQEQVTFDEYNDWFPHISPDGQWIVFLSFGPEIQADDHPFYKHVYIRMMPAAGGKPGVIAYVYGGQGTINVPSWSPDSKKIAFVSNSDSAH